MMNLLKFASYFSPIDSLLPAQTKFAWRVKHGPSTAMRHHSARARSSGILVPLDGSEFAEHAIPMALGIAEQTGAGIELVHIVVPTEVLSPYDALYFADDALETKKRTMQAYLDTVIERVREHSSVRVKAKVIEARSAPAAIRERAAQKSRLLVMASRGKGMLRRFWSGSVSHAVLKNLPVPAIFVRGSTGPATLTPRPAKDLLLPFAGSNIERAAPRAILELGLFPHARVKLLHVVPLAPQRVVTEGNVSTQWAPSWDDWFAGSRRLKPVSKTLRKSGRQVETHVVSSSEPFGQTILAHGKQHDADLIAVPHRRQSLLGRLLWPSASDYLFRKSTRPILFVPSRPARAQLHRRHEAADEQAIAVGAN